MGSGIQLGDSKTTKKATEFSKYWCAPEVIDEKIEKVTYKSDVWSLGAILFYMVTGVTPFSSSSYKNQNNFINKMQQQLPIIDFNNNKIVNNTSWVKEILEGCCDYDLNKRWDMKTL